MTAVPITSAPVVYKPSDYRSDLKPIWCPGCGDFGVLAAIQQALAAAQINPKDLAVVSGIGCSSRLPGFLQTYGLHTVHGRALPAAIGLKIARPDLTVMAVGGDGDFFSIGLGHLPHAARRDLDITVVVMDNAIYGLTKGQTSPTSPRGHVTKSTPYGQSAQPLHPLAIVLSSGASFVARGFSSQPKQLAELIKAGLDHRGFAFIHVLSPCVTFTTPTSCIRSWSTTCPTHMTHPISMRRCIMQLRASGCRSASSTAARRSNHCRAQRPSRSIPKPI